MIDTKMPNPGDKIIVNQREYIVKYIDFHEGEILLSFDATKLVMDKYENAIKERKNFLKNE